MVAATISAHGVMEGGGSYNLHAKVPAGGANLALPYLEQATRALTLPTGSDPILIADYGSSQGKNSLAPLRTAIRCLRERLGPDRAVMVVHVDQHANDFNTLFDVLHTDSERYAIDDSNVFPSAIGRSFYENVFPAEQVDLGWCSYAAVWLSRIPALVPDHFVAHITTGDVRTIFDRQAADDWRLFLSLRAHELRPGGRLLVVLPGLSDSGTSGFEPLFNCANAILGELVHEGVIGDDERKRMVLGIYPRRRAQLLEPFSADGRFQSLSVEHCELFDLPDAAWADYQQDGSVDALVSRHAAFFRAIFVPSLASAIAVAERRQTFADCLEQKLKKRLAERLTAFHSFVQIMVLAKQGSAATSLTLGTASETKSDMAPAAQPGRGPSPTLVFDTLLAYERTAALKAAIDLNLFRAIGDGPSDITSLARQCSASERGLRILCDYLTIMGFLHKVEGGYRHTPTSAAFLDPRSPACIAPISRFLGSPLMTEPFKDLANIVRNGRTTLPGAGSVEPENSAWVDFAHSMAPMMAPMAAPLAGIVMNGSSGPVRVLDIAAGHGLFGIEIAKQHEDAQIVALDWAPVLEVAKANARTAGVIHRFTTVVGSAFDVDYGGPYDIVLLTNFLHHFDSATCIRLLRKVHAALKPSGRVAALEFVPNEDRISPPMAAGFSLVMLATTEAGDAYTFRELQNMYLEAGFKRANAYPVQNGPHTVVMAEAH